MLPPDSGDDVDGEAGRLQFSEASRRDHRYFGRVADVRHVVRGLVAARGVADVQAIDRQARLDAAAAVDREDREHRAGVDVVVVRQHAGHGGEQVAVAPDARQVAHGLVVERDLAPRALHVDDRRLAGDRHGFSNPADLQVRVDLDDAGSRQHDVVALQRGEPREGERDGVGARLQALDTVLPGAIGHRCPGLFNQHRAGRFNGDAGQDGAGRVPHGAGQGRLGPRGRRGEPDARQQRHESYGSQHVYTPSLLCKSHCSCCLPQTGERFSSVPSYITSADEIVRKSPYFKLIQAD